MAEKLVVKVLDKDREFKTTIPRSLISWGVSFSSVINSGFGSLTLTIMEWYNYAGIIHWDIIVIIDWSKNIVSEVWGAIVQDEYYLYQWVVDSIERAAELSKTYVKVWCTWLQSLMSQTIYTYSGNKAFTRTASPDAIVKEILDLFSDHFSYTTGTIPAYGSNISVEFDYTDCLEAIKTVQEISGRIFTIDGDGVCTFKAAGTDPDHMLVFQKDITSIVTYEDGSEIVNSYVVEYDGGFTSAIEDATSISTYGKREKQVGDSSLKNSATATAYGNALLAKTKDPKYNTEIEVNNSYDLESLKPGQVVTVTNTDYDIVSKVIQKVQYKQTSAVLYLDAYENLSTELKKLL